MTQIIINDHRVVLLSAVNANLQALDGKVQELAAQRRQLAAAYYAELQRAASEQGHELAPGASVQFKDSQIIIAWPDVEQEGDG